MLVLEFIANKLRLLLLFKRFVADTFNQRQMFDIKKINDHKILFFKTNVDGQILNYDLERDKTTGFEI